MAVVPTLENRRPHTLLCTCGRARFLVVSHVFWTNSFSSPREGTKFVSAEYLQFVCRVFDLTFHGQFCRQHVNWLTPTTALPLPPVSPNRCRHWFPHDLVHDNLLRPDQGRPYTLCRISAIPSNTIDQSSHNSRSNGVTHKSTVPIVS